MWFKIGCETYWVVEVRRIEGRFGLYRAICTTVPGCTVKFEQWFMQGSRVTFCDEDGFTVGEEIELRCSEQAEAIYRKLETELALEQLENL